MGSQGSSLWSIDPVMYHDKLWIAKVGVNDFKWLSGCIGNVRYVRCVDTMICGTVRWYGEKHPNSHLLWKFINYTIICKHYPLSNWKSDYQALMSIMTVQLTYPLRPNVSILFATGASLCHTLQGLRRAQGNLRSAGEWWCQNGTITKNDIESDNIHNYTYV